MQYQQRLVSLTERKTAKYGYFDCTTAILKYMKINEMNKCVSMLIFRIIRDFLLLYSSFHKVNLVALLVECKVFPSSG